MQFKTDIGRDPGPVIADRKSQAGQDLFVIAMTQGKTQGRWLELGAERPVYENNTWLLEKHFDWHGDSIEIQEEITKPTKPLNDWNIQRPRANLIIADAILFDYSTLSGPYDYLQLDIDSPTGTVDCLKSVMQYHRPGVVTLEHDAHIGTEDHFRCRVQTRDLMSKAGYVLVANDVTCEFKKIWTFAQPIYFEDWYAHPDFISMDIINAYRSVDFKLRPKYYYDILFEQGATVNNR